MEDNCDYDNLKGVIGGNIMNYPGQRNGRNEDDIQLQINTTNATHNKNYLSSGIPMHTGETENSNYSSPENPKKKLLDNRDP